MSRANRGVRFLVAALLLLPFAASAQNVARVTYLSGVLYAQTAKGDVRRLVQGAEVAVGDQVSTDAQSWARLAFPDGAEFLLRENTRILIQAYSFVEQQPEKDSLVMQLLKGGMRAASGLIGKRREAKNFQVGTVASTIGIRGTVFDALLCQRDCLGGADGLYTHSVVDPHTLTNDTGETEVPAGASFYVRDRQSRPEDISDLGGLGLPIPGDAGGARRVPRPNECF
jgi:hypothetical protein